MTDDYRSPSDDRIRKQIDAALKDTYIRSASHIVEIIKRALDLIDEQSPPVIEALIDYGKDEQHAGKWPGRRDIRACLIAYCENTLKESRERERRLYHGLTGRPDDEKK